MQMKSKMKRIKNILLVVTILAVISGTAWIAHAVINGQPDDDNHPYVGLVTDFFTGGVNVCSCVAISETILITSAHCFQDEETVFVTFDPAVDPGDPFAVTWYVGTFYLHDEFCIGCGAGLPGFDTHDVAVIELFGDGVDLSRYAILPGEGVNDTLAMRTEVTTVGYGVTHFIRGGGQPVWGFPEGGFTRHFAPVQLIASKHKHQNEYIKLSGNPAKGKGKFCFGDSGGPNLLSGTDTILALTAYGANHMCAGVGYANRIDTYYALEFIRSYLP
jgi:hypothetical protein